ncbi:TAM domain methyltransferase [Colletotrichum salicis]|uniref:TAM domain methyltransferase n=1 Tax=Colletotrichum salicis TaxID=1209931 RepID=A0A135RVH8_9PEZI|nr:TAM domain methyltransferase [Colletotrichum salicis]
MAEVDHEVNIVADEQSLEDSRADIESIASSGTSISGSILDYRFENGRTYHRYKDGSIWAIQFGGDHPEAEVLGVDLSATQTDFLATNVEFEIDDIDEEWTYTLPFDYIHSRFMSSSIADWKVYLTNHIQPGGYLELQEPEMEFQADGGTFPSDCPLAKYGNLLKEAAAIFGREYVAVSSLKTLMVEDPAFKELGAWGFKNSNAGLEAISIAPLTRAHKWTRGEVDVFLADVRKDLANKNYHTYIPIYTVVGRMPLKAATPAVATETAPAEASA